MLLTVIIPAYNCESTIVRAVESIKIQSIKDIEIIIVNNGSTDGTKEIALSLAAKNENIIYSESIKGVSNARNKGIELAKGKWITFLDSDDCLLKDENFYSLKSYLSETSIDLIIGNYLVNNFKIDLYSMNMDLNSTEDILKRSLENPTKYLTAWGKFYLTSLVKENNIKFDPSLSYSEDSEFLIRYFLLCKTVKFIPLCVYNYYLSKGSTVRSYNSKMLQEYERSIKKIAFDLAEYPDLKKSFSIFILMQINLLMVHNIFQKQTNNKLRKLIKVFRKDYVLKSLNYITFRDVLIPRYLPLIFCKLHCYVLAAVIYKLRAFQDNVRTR